MPEFTPAITAHHPHFSDDSKSVAMICHAVDVLRNAVHHLNTCQVPVIIVDQPLFTITMQMQWTWPVGYEEDKPLLIILSGLHLEMANLKLIGDSKMVRKAILQAKLASPGMVDSFLKISHVIRSRHASSNSH